MSAIKLVVILFMISSCSILEKKHGRYSAFIFEEPNFEKSETKELVKQRHIELWSEGCGFVGLNLEKHYKGMIPKYKELANNQLVGIADVEVFSYVLFLGVTAVPCLKVRAVPLVVL